MESRTTKSLSFRSNTRSQSKTQTGIAMLRTMINCKKVEKRNFWANRMVTLILYCPRETERRLARQMKSAKLEGVGDRPRLWADI